MLMAGGCAFFAAVDCLILHMGMNGTTDGAGQSRGAAADMRAAMICLSAKCLQAKRFIIVLGTAKQYNLPQGYDDMIQKYNKAPQPFVLEFVPTKSSITMPLCLGTMSGMESGQSVMLAFLPFYI